MKFKDIVFIDIETAGEQPGYQHLNTRMRALWDKKAMQISKNEEDTPETLYNRAAIYAEFGKVICVSVAYSKGEKFCITSFYGDEEKHLLTAFANMLHRDFSKSQYRLCAHNGKEFDFPYLCRRMLINGIKIPEILQVQGKKPWETRFLDTMELWKFGDYKHYTSLELLSAIFNIPSPKDDIDGSRVHEVYWQQHDLERIKTYCEKDVLTISQLIRCFTGKPLIAENEVEYVQRYE